MEGTKICNPLGEIMGQVPTTAPLPSGSNTLGGPSPQPPQALVDRIYQLEKESQNSQQRIGVLEGAIRQLMHLLQTQVGISI